MSPDPCNSFNVGIIVNEEEEEEDNAKEEAVDAGVDARDFILHLFLEGCIFFVYVMFCYNFK